MEFGKVIKVKFEDTLRRFTVPLDPLNGGLDLDMAGLRAKILSLFNFPADTDFTLTYLDEDGDVVTLVDDEDMRDMMSQDLKFLRIEVQLSNDNAGKPYGGSSGSSTPLRSPYVQQPFSNIKNGVVKVMKSVPQALREQLSPEAQHPFPNVKAGESGGVEPLPVPQPLREPLSKLCLDMASKAASSPVPADLLDFLLKIGQSYMNVDSHTHAGAESSCTQDVARGSNAAKDGDMEDVMPKSEFVDPATKNSCDVNTGNVTVSVGAPVTSLPASVDLNFPPSDSNLSGVKLVKFAPVVSNVPAGDPWKVNKDGCRVTKHGNGFKSFGCDASASSSIPTRPSPIANLSGNPMSQCPFAGIPMVNGSSIPFANHPFKRSHSHTASMGGMFHKGIQCDGCGVHPIVGPRYKSKVKEDFDLCSICFSEMGNETEYTRMDRPMPFRHARSLRGLHEQVNSPWAGAPVLPHDLYRSRPRLDSRFILDVNVIDGTIMAPSTPFTKIWRMRNSGSLTWPRGTQLVWIGGDRYSDAPSVDLEIPSNGVPVDKELDIAVDFTAPASPGRYMSYWRMASPSGQKFGQRVWVLIQVDASLKDSFCVSLEDLNLNLPPVNCGSKGPEITGVNVQPDGELLQPGNSNAGTEPMKPVVDEQPRKDHDLNFPINDALLVGQGISSSAAPEAVSYPIVDLSEVAPALPTQAPSNAHPPTPTAPTLVPSVVVVGPTSSAQGAVAKNAAVEETLLKELEEMGFKQVDLNKEILRINEYNLEQSVDHLCGVSEWDPILEELQEMGFCDNDTNKRLLKKNNGSIKRVVMDLISGEKA
ncbi:protein JOKA2 [Corylus avellana]|uniref:protein JOKA2 n=1 Tax=Corylus avellana TaxID=13451 RepID=UPI001E1F9230|nr:protein JOKA2 [Corylus avellana]XP_059441397.1 protein JOKA2 [Corylus avellana]